MRQTSNLILILVILMTAIGCQKRFKLIEVVDESKPIILISRNVNTKSELFRMDTLQVNSDKWNGFVQIAEIDSGNWEPVFTSFNSDYYIKQNNFTLLFWKDGQFVVVNFIDENGKVKQLSKRITKGEYDFLSN